MRAFTVEPEDGESIIFGKEVSELQGNIEVGYDFIKGTLHYVTGYTGFSGDPRLQEGNYLALKVDDVPDDAIMQVEVIGGHSGPVTLDEDLNCVLRLEDPWTQSIRISCTVDGATDYKEFSLGGLTFEEED